MIIPLAAAGAVMTAPAASASHSDHRGDRGNRVSDTESCRRGDSEITLSARDTDRGRILVRVDLDTDRRHREWVVRIRQNGDTIFWDSERTDRRGNLTVWDTTRDRRGTDHFRATATNRRTGERCDVDVSLRESRHGDRDGDRRDRRDGDNRGDRRHDDNRGDRGCEKRDQHKADNRGQREDNRGQRDCVHHDQRDDRPSNR